MPFVLRFDWLVLVDIIIELNFEVNTHRTFLYIMCKELIINPLLMELTGMISDEQQIGSRCFAGYPNSHCFGMVKHVR
jgi:hypothetical protein